MTYVFMLRKLDFCSDAFIELLASSDVIDIIMMSLYISASRPAVWNVIRATENILNKTLRICVVVFYVISSHPDTNVRSESI